MLEGLALQLDSAPSDPTRLFLHTNLSQIKENILKSVYYQKSW